MKFKRLGDGARALTRAGAHGPEAVYARVLDGEHLWLAVDADLGRPALRDPASGRLVEATPLPDEDPAYVSTRIRLDDVLPSVEDAELELVALAGDGARPTPLRAGSPPPEGCLRVPPTGDGQWRFQVEPDAKGFLRVRRTRAARVARLTEISTDGYAVRLVLRAPETELDPQLHFVTKDGLVARSVTGEAVGGDLVIRVRATDLPEEPAGYRVAVGPVSDPVTAVRLHNDVNITESLNVMLPHLLDPETEAIAGRFLFGQQGVLRLTRKGDTEETS